MNHQLTCQYLSISFFLFFAYTAVGQSTISGTITNEKGEALAFANVVLLTAQDSTFVTGTTTNELGYFEVKRPLEEAYLLAVHMLGFQSAYISVFPQEASLQLSNIRLVEGGIALNTVEVLAEKPLLVQAIDRTIINLENRVAKMGTSVLDVLERLPGVVVDRQNETISLLGKDGIHLLINDRRQYITDEALFNYLSGMNADNLTTVELITTPPANFDAQGNAGFINLQLKQYPGDGWNGHYSLAAGYGNGQVVNGNLDFNFRRKPLAIAFTYNLSNHGQGQFTTIDRRVGRGENFLETQARTNRDPYVNTHNLRLVTDYQINDKLRVGSVLTGYLRHWNMEADYSILFRPISGLDTLIDATLVEENDWRSLQGNLNFNYQWNAKTSISADFDYLWYDNENPNDYRFTYQLSDGTDLSGFDLISDKKTPFTIQVGRIDFQRELGANLKWSSGVKTSFSTFENNVRVLRNEVVLPAFTALNDLREIVGAMYGQFEYQVSEKIQFKGGLRYEYSDTELGDATGALLVDRAFGALFPTFYAQVGAFNFAYGKRINRPSFRAMAPFQFFVGPNTSNAGNPLLQPAISHNLTANYRWKTIQFTFEYMKEDSAIAFFQNRFDPNTNTQTILPRNLQEEEYISFSVSSPIPLTQWWRLRVFANYFYLAAVTQEELGTFAFGQNSFSANLNQTFSLPKEWTFELSGFYRSVGLNGNVLMQPYGGVTLGLQKKFANGARLAITLSDLFESIQSRGITDLPEEHIFVDRMADFSNRTLRVSYRHSFGDKRVEEIRREREVEEGRRM